MPNRTFLKLLLFPLILLTFSGHSQQEVDSLKWNDWNFRISPYIWLVGLEGEIYRPPFPVNTPEPPPPRFDIDVKFRDIRNSIKFISMLAGQYRGNSWVAQFNSSALIIESEAITPLELLLQDNVLRFTYFGGDVFGGYRILKRPKIEIDVLAGFKYIYLELEAVSTLGGRREVEGRTNQNWIDPSFGANIRYTPSRKVHFVGYLDFGIPYLDVDRSAQFFGLVQYHFTKTFYTSLGYRQYYIEIPKDEAIFNGSLKGFILHIGFQF